ncbi:MAG: uroporphyrinogen decarboxylase family protein [Caldilineaceae bacterium]
MSNSSAESMTAKERVLTTFERRVPDRVPLWYGADASVTHNLMRILGAGSEEALMQRLHIDFRRVRERYDGPPLAHYPDGSRQSWWGVDRIGDYYGQPYSHPLAGVETMEEIESYSWPSPDWFDFSHLRQECAAWPEYAIIGGPWVVIFTDATELVGMSEFFMKMITHPELMKAVIQKVSDFYYEMAVRTFEACADLLDIFFFGDDLGTQQALFISPQMWDEFLKDHFVRFLELGRQAGLKTMFHSCGSVRGLMGRWSALGLDALNPIQRRAKGMELDELKRSYGDRLCFHGAIDHQQVLTFGSVADVRKEVQDVIDVLAPGGGYCLAASHDLLLAEMPPENIIAMFDEGHEYGRYA